MKFKMKFKKVIAIASVFTILSTVPSFAAGIGSGTDHTFTTELPTFSDNIWFIFRKKETNTQNSKIKLTQKPSKCEGANVWIENGFKTRVSQVIKVTDKNTKTIRIIDAGTARKGKTVRLGLEDRDKTVIFKHTIKGIINYG